MAWNDGITKQLSEFLQTYTDLDAVTKQAFESVIDEESAKFEQRIQSSVPVKTGKLKASFKIERKVDRRNWYGYNAEFEGNAPNGEPYQKIANILNYGRPADENAGAVAGTFFVTKAIRKLRGMDDRIKAKIEAELIKKG